MVEAVRAGQSLRQVASSFGVSLSTVAHWIEQARGKRLDRVQFANRKPGRAWNRTSARVEQRILLTRRKLRDKSVLGEYGADAIGLALQEQATVRSTAPIGQVPAHATIYRVLERHGALDAAHRQRRPAPPRGWHLPGLAAAEGIRNAARFSLAAFLFTHARAISNIEQRLAKHRRLIVQRPSPSLIEGPSNWLITLIQYFSLRA